TPARYRLDLLAGIEQSLRVEGPLQLAMQLHCARAPLALEPAPLRPADPVLAGDRAAEPDRHREELFGPGPGAVELRLVARVDDEVRVHVAVARVTPAAGLQAVAAADLDRLLDRLRQAVERHDHVLAGLAAAERDDGEGHALAPAPQLGRLGREDSECLVAED